MKFNGISEDIFNCCERSKKIRIPINMLKELREEIEPELKKINPEIKGHVSRIKDRGTNNYRNWAWLYFNTQPREAYKFSQLSVNVSPRRLYVGVDIRTSSEYQNYRKEVMRLENKSQIENDLRILSERDLFVSTEADNWDNAIARKHSVEELRGDLLTPALFWINVPFEKIDPRLRNKSIAKEIVKIFKDLYNIYAFASGNKTISQNITNHSFIPPIEVEDVDSIELQGNEKRKIDDFLNSLKEGSTATNYYLPGRDDQFVIKRKALEYNLTPQKITIKEADIIIYSDQDIGAFKDTILLDYEQFARLLREIAKLFPLPRDFLKIMFVNVLTDARYSKANDANQIFVNLAAFHSQRDRFFWLFTIIRELAYIKTHRLGYPFFKDMRWLTMHALNNLKL
jgi:hypothetical protein